MANLVPQRRVAAITLGCRLNQAETALLFSRLRRAGYEPVRNDAAEPIDVLLVNTCTVTGTAAQKSRQAVRKFRRDHPDCCIVVTGCSVTVEKSLWTTEPSVDIVLPNPEKIHLVEHLDRFFAQTPPRRLLVAEPAAPPSVFREGATGDFPFRSRALLKIQEGCNNFCTYCIVPYARGRERSRAWDEVTAEFQQMLERGFREIVLAGVNVSAYRDGDRNLVDLVRYLASRPGDFRLRMSSMEPHPDNREIIDAMAESPNVCRFLHLSAQNGSDPILRAMNRHYTVAEYEDFAAYARRRIPQLHLGTDIIVGFPGETEENFQETCAFVRRLAFANTHIFTFSPREGTPAAVMSGQLDGRTLTARHEALRAVADESASAFRRSLIGQTLPVLFEHRLASGDWVGWSDNYVSVACAGAAIRHNDLLSLPIVGEDSQSKRLRAVLP